MAKKKYGDTIEAQVKTLARGGRTQREISAQTGICKSSVHKILHRPDTAQVVGTLARLPKPKTARQLAKELQRVTDLLHQNNLKRKIKRRNRLSHVYGITDEIHYKIGIAFNVQKRLAGLQSANPRPLRIVFDIAFSHFAYSSEPARRLERRLHEKFSNKRIQGEWFVLDERDLAYIARKVEQINPQKRGGVNDRASAS